MIAPVLMLILSPQDFAYGMPVVTQEPAAAYRLELPLDVYRKVVRADLGDLRVFNSQGASVPYELRSPEQPSATRPPGTRLSLFPLRGDPGKALDAMRLTIESGRASLDLRTQGAPAAPATVGAYILDGRVLKVPVSSLRLEWPDDAPDFAGRVNIEASDDLGSWRIVGDSEPVANLRAGAERLIEQRVEFTPTQAKFWRLSWAGDHAPFSITGVVAEPAEHREDVKRATMSKKGAATDKPEAFAVDLGTRLPIDRVNIEWPESNSVGLVTLMSRESTKDEWGAVLRHGFYRLDGPAGELRNGFVPIAVNRHRHWLLKLEKSEDAAGGAPALTVGWIPHELVFVARGQGPYTLAFGSGAVLNGETTLSTVLPRMKIGSASLAPLVELGGATRLEPPQAPFPWKSVLLWAVLLIGVAMLAWMTFRLIKQMNGSAKPPAA